MTKYSFLDDYSEGCHPRILEALSESNLVQQMAYGEDLYSQEARALMHKELGSDKAAIYFVASGTLANIIITSSCLRPHEAIIAPETGHMVVREAGAIEATGHKIITMPTDDGKLTPDDLQKALNENAHYPHMAKPRMVYISNATETGRFYTKAELVALSKFCRTSKLLLFIDGARLGAALTATDNDVTFKDIAKLADIFWLGGTKMGALLGEAIVVTNDALADGFLINVKQRGGLLAKGRVVGIQFRELFNDGLFYDVCGRTNRLAAYFSSEIERVGFELAAKPETNQIFAILPNAVIEKLEQKFAFYNWEPIDEGQTVIRLVTSWTTDKTKIDEFVTIMNG